MVLKNVTIKKWQVKRRATTFLGNYLGKPKYTGANKSSAQTVRGKKRMKMLTWLHAGWGSDSSKRTTGKSEEEKEEGNV